MRQAYTLEDTRVPFISPVHSIFFFSSPCEAKIFWHVMHREMVRELCRKITKEQAKLEIQQCYLHANMWTITFHLSNQRHTGYGAHETYRVGIVFLFRVRWPARDAKYPPSASSKVKNRNMWCLVCTVSRLGHRLNGYGRGWACLVLVARSLTRNFRIAWVWGSNRRPPDWKLAVLQLQPIFSVWMYQPYVTSHFRAHGVVLNYAQAPTAYFVGTLVQ
jgi:hypothetical protein